MQAEPERAADVAAADPTDTTDTPPTTEAAEPAARGDAREGVERAEATDVSEPVESDSAADTPAAGEATETSDAAETAETSDAAETAETDSIVEAIAASEAVEPTDAADAAAVSEAAVSEAAVSEAAASEAAASDAETDDAAAAASEAVETNDAAEATGFAALGVTPALVAVLADDEIVDPTEIQTLAIPPLLAGRDVIGQARTGTGKTAAYVVPMLQRLDLDRRGVQALVLAPTRELAVQVARVTRRFARGDRRIRVATIYGGVSYGPQLGQLQRGAQVAVATPGRLIDLLDRGALSLAGVATIVIDEADEMLEMGFVDDIERILGDLPGERQGALFSATMPPAIRRIAKKHLRDAVDARTEGAGEAAAGVAQQVVFADDDDQLMVLDRLLCVERGEQTLVFVRTRDGSLEVADALVAQGHRAAALSGAMSQAARADVLRAFREGRIRVLVGTDVAARGLDIDDITHVINLGPPDTPQSYVHRIGRTGRAGRAGVAITILRPRDRRIAHAIEHHLGNTLTRRRWPTAEAVGAARATTLVGRVAEAATDEAALAVHLDAIDALVALGFDLRTIAAAAARLAEGDRPAPATRTGAEAVPYMIGSGAKHRVRPGDVVGALCNELRLDRSAIGYVDVGRSATVVWLAPSTVRALDGVEAITLRGRRTAIWPDGTPAPPPPAQTTRRDDANDRRPRGRASGNRRSRPYKGSGKSKGPARSSGKSDRPSRERDRSGKSRERTGKSRERTGKRSDRAGTGGDRPFRGWKGRRGGR